MGWLESTIRGDLSSLHEGAARGCLGWSSGDKWRGAEESIRGTGHRKVVGGRGLVKKVTKQDSTQHKRKQKLHKKGGTHPFDSTKVSKLYGIGLAAFGKKTRKLWVRKRSDGTDHVDRPVARCCSLVATGGVGRDTAKELHATTLGKRDAAGVSLEWGEACDNAKVHLVRDGENRLFAEISSPQEARSGRSYKEALLKPVPISNSPSTRYTTKQRKNVHSPVRRERGRRCFRCLAFDHLVRECIDPIRCIRCYRIDHLVRDCRSHRRRRMQGASRFRPHSMKAFVPLSEGFYLRQ